MKQMVAPTATVFERVPFGTIAAGFFRYGRDGKVYFAQQWGKETLHFPVLADGRVSRHTGTSVGVPIIFPHKIVEVITGSNLGIGDINLCDDLPED
jgi:hypothetical protein